MALSEERSDPHPTNVCGIVMPISSIDGYSAEHWTDVLSIISAAVDGAGFKPNLVSNADDAGVIQKRIIENLYNNPICVCDVSAKNANVMFELGMRLAFDKPTIIIKDDVTAYSFDTAPIEHLTYPRDLRFNKIELFKRALAQKISATYEAAQNSENYTTFLKHFGEFKIAKIQAREVSSEEYIVDQLKSLAAEVASLRNSISAFSDPPLFSTVQSVGPAGGLGAVFADGWHDRTDSRTGRRMPLAAKIMWRGKESASNSLDEIKAAAAEIEAMSGVTDVNFRRSGDRFFINVYGYLSADVMAALKHRFKDHAVAHV
jgi:hypothetical protein